MPDLKACQEEAWFYLHVNAPEGRGAHQAPLSPGGLWAPAAKSEQLSTTRKSEAWSSEAGRAGISQMGTQEAQKGLGLRKGSQPEPEPWGVVAGPLRVGKLHLQVCVGGGPVFALQGSRVRIWRDGLPRRDSQASPS